MMAALAERWHWQPSELWRLPLHEIEEWASLAIEIGEEQARAAKHGDGP